MLASASHGNIRPIRRIPGSSYSSPAYFFQSARPWVSISQPVWACQSPARPEPWPTCGECGSPSSSACAWCLRWSATQSITEPWRPIEPRTANVYSVGLWVRKLRCVSSRW